MTLRQVQLLLFVVAGLTGAWVAYDTVRAAVYRETNVARIENAAPPAAARWSKIRRRAGELDRHGLTGRPGSSTDRSSPPCPWTDAPPTNGRQTADRHGRRRVFRRPRELEALTAPR